MADNMTREERGKQMALIHNKNTKPELELKHLFWHLGYHYRYSNWKQLPGKPDLVFVGRKKVVFLHGCFWHRHNCKLATMPKTHAAFWKRKFEQNIKNDLANHKKLRNLGWHVIILWECEIKEDFEQLIKVTESEMKQYYMIDSL